MIINRFLHTNTHTNEIKNKRRNQCLDHRCAQTWLWGWMDCSISQQSANVSQLYGCEYDRGLFFLFLEAFSKKGLRANKRKCPDLNLTFSYEDSSFFFFFKEEISWLATRGAQSTLKFSTLQQISHVHPPLLSFSFSFSLRGNLIVKPKLQNV